MLYCKWLRLHVGKDTKTCNIHAILKRRPSEMKSFSAPHSSRKDEGSSLGLKIGNRLGASRSRRLDPHPESMTLWSVLPPVRHRALMKSTNCEGGAQAKRKSMRSRAGRRANAVLGIVDPWSGLWVTHVRVSAWRRVPASYM